jgi:[glutamine synthetase] adenylyltransferase / [glutamine synthetase]-adenylyl-L-tyrosine phosphorylase
MVDLCAGSPFLSALLINNPGMIDELLDTLVLDQPRGRDDLLLEFEALLKGAVDLEPIVHSFQDKELLRIGVRDMLGKSLIQDTQAALSDLAEAIVLGIYRMHEKTVAARYGVPVSRFAIIGLGKLGGREISYHSDLDLLVVYESDGQTESDTGSTSLAHYFTDLAQRATRTLTQSGPMGRLYAVDMRLRPFGKSGSLAVPLKEFRRYFAADGAAQLWERQALCRARVLGPADDFTRAVRAEITLALRATPWTDTSTAELVAMRRRLEAASTPRNLKRGPGGLVDIEFALQLFQLKYGTKFPSILKPSVWEVFFPIRGTGLLSPTEATALTEHYTFLRSVEAKLRIVTDRPLNDLPDDVEALAALARRMGFDAHSGKLGVDRFVAELARITKDVRRIFDAITLRESGGHVL